MERLVRTISRQLERAAGIEHFVQLVVGGGLTLVVGLWSVALTPAWTSLWLVGSVLVLLGVAGITMGIRSEIEW